MMNRSRRNHLDDSNLSNSELDDEFSVKDKNGRIWTDSETFKLIEMLQKDSLISNFPSNYTKRDFCLIAKSFAAVPRSEFGPPPNWRECRNRFYRLKAQYHRAKEQIENFDLLDLESEEVVDALQNDCKDLDVLPSFVKHFRYLRRLFMKQNEASYNKEKNAGIIRNETSGSISSSIQIKDANSCFVSLEQIDEIDEFHPGSVSPADSIDTTFSLYSKEVDCGFNDQKNDSILSKGVSVSKDKITEGLKFIEDFNKNMIRQSIAFHTQMKQYYRKQEEERDRLHMLERERMRQEYQKLDGLYLGMHFKFMRELNASYSAFLDRFSKVETVNDDANQEEN